MVNNQNAAQSTTKPSESDGISSTVNPNVETSPVIIATSVTNTLSEINVITDSPTKSVEVEATNANENVAVTKIPIETSTGIIAGIIAHGSTIEPITIKDVIETTIVTTISPETPIPERETSTTKAEILPVIIESKEKTAEQTTILPQTTVSFNAENVDATTIIIESVKLSKASTASNLQQESKATSEIPATTITIEKATIVPVVIAGEEKTVGTSTETPKSTAVVVEKTTPLNAENIEIDATTIIPRTFQSSDATTVVALIPIASLGEGQIVEGGITTSEPIIETTIVSAETLSKSVTEIPHTTVETKEATIVPIIITGKENIVKTTTAIPESAVISVEKTTSESSESIDATTIIIEKIKSSDATTVAAPISIAPLGEGQIVVGGSTTSEPTVETTVLLSESKSAANLVTEVQTTFSNEKTTPQNAEIIDIEATTIIPKTIQSSDATTVVASIPIAPLGEGQIVVGGSTTSEPAGETTIISETAQPSDSTSVIPPISNVVPVIPIGEGKIVEGESTTNESKVDLTVDTTDVPVTEDVTLVPVTVILESNSSAINVAVTEVPIETSTGIIDGIVAHGSTIESITEEKSDITTVTDLQRTTTESVVTSVINNAFVPVIITNDKNNTEADETATINVNVENLATSTSIPVTAENVDAKTVVSETVISSESTTVSEQISIAPLEGSQSTVPIASLGEGEIVEGVSTTISSLAKTTILLAESLSTTTTSESEASVVPVIINTDENKVSSVLPENAVIAVEQTTNLESIDATTIISETLKLSESTTVVEPISIAPLENAKSVAPVAPLGEGQVVESGNTTSEPEVSTIAINEKATIVPIIITNTETVTEAITNIPGNTVTKEAQTKPETADATTIIAKTMTLIESTTASIDENSPSEIPIAPLGEGQIVDRESTTSAPKTEPNIGSTALQNEISATTVAAEITEKVLAITEQIQQTTESDALTEEIVHQPMGIIAEIIAHGSTVPPVIQENATITSVVTEAPFQIVTAAETNKVETSTTNEKIVPAIISDNENVAESSTIIPKTSVSTEDNISSSTIAVINAENIDTVTAETVSSSEVTTIETATFSVLENSQTVETNEEKDIQVGSTTAVPINNVMTTVADSTLAKVLITQSATEVSFTESDNVGTSTVEQASTLKQDIIPVVIPVEEGKFLTTNAVNPNAATTVQSDDVSTIETATVSISQLGEEQDVIGGSTTVEPLLKTTILESREEATTLTETVTDNPLSTIVTEKVTVLPIIVEIEKQTTEIPENTVTANAKTTPLNAENADVTPIETATVSIAPLANSQSIAPIAQLGEGQIVEGGITSAEPIAKTTVKELENLSTLVSAAVTDVPLTTTAKATIVPIIIPDNEKIVEITTEVPESTVSVDVKTTPLNADNVDATTIISETLKPSESTTVAEPVSIAPLENAQSIAPVAPLGEGQILEGGVTTSEPITETTILVPDSSSKSGIATELHLTTSETKETTIVPVIVAGEEKIVKTTPNTPKSTLIIDTKTTLLNAEDVDITTIVAENIQLTETTTLVAPISIAPLDEGQIVEGGSTTSEPKTEAESVFSSTNKIVTEIPVTTIKINEETATNSKSETFVPVILTNEESIKSSTGTPQTTIVSEDIKASTIGVIDAENVDAPTIVPITVISSESTNKPQITNVNGAEGTESPITTSAGIIAAIIAHGNTVKPVTNESEITSSVTEGTTVKAPEQEILEAQTSSTILPIENIPVIIPSDQKPTESSTKISVTEIVATSKTGVLGAQNKDATTIISETVVPSESTTAADVISIAPLENSQSIAPIAPLGEGQIVEGGITTSEQTIETTIVPAEPSSKTVTEIPHTTIETHEATIVPIVVAGEEKLVEPTTEIPEKTSTALFAVEQTTHLNVENIDSSTNTFQTIQPSEETTVVSPISIAPLGEGQIVVGGSTTVDRTAQSTTVSSSTIAEGLSTTVETKEATILPIIISNEENGIKTTTKVSESTVIGVEQTTPLNAENFDATTVISETVIPSESTTVSEQISIAQLESAQSTVPIAPLGEGQIVNGGSTTVKPIEENETTIAEQTTFETRSPVILVTTSNPLKQNSETTIVANVDSEIRVSSKTQITDNVNETIELIPVAIVGKENVKTTTIENIEKTEIVTSTFEPEKITIATLIMPKKIETVETVERSTTTAADVPVTVISDTSEKSTQNQRTPEVILEATTILSTSETSKPLIVLPLEVSENNPTTTIPETVTTVETTELPVTSETTVVVHTEGFEDNVPSSSAIPEIVTTIETATTQLPINSETSVPLVLAPLGNAENIQASSTAPEITTVVAVNVTEVISEKATTAQSTGIPPHLKHIVGVVSKTDPQATTDYDYSDSDDETTLSQNAASTTFSPEAIAAAAFTNAPVVIIAESSSTTTSSPEDVKTTVPEEAAVTESTTEVVVDKVTEIPIVPVTEVAAESTNIIVAVSSSTTKSPEAETSKTIVTESTTEAVVDKVTEVPIVVIPENIQKTKESDIISSTTTKPELVEAVSDLIDIVQGKPKPKEEMKHNIDIEDNFFNRTVEPPVAAVQALIDTLEQTRNIEEVLRHSGRQPEIQNETRRILTDDPECAHGSLYFSAAEIQSYDKPFEIIVGVYNLQECLRLCWDSNCYRAAFTRFPRPTCLMRIGSENKSIKEGCPNKNASTLLQNWKFTHIAEALEIECIKCVKTEVLNKELSPNAKSNPQQLEKKIFNPHGESTKCDGRVQFQISPVSSLPKLNVSNDVPADSPADCARKCFERDGCTLAGFVPTTNGRGVCLLTTDNGICGDDANHVPQHASTIPFLISCIKCSKCKYSLSSFSPSSSKIPNFEEFAHVFNINQCAEECAKRQCTLAQFDPNSLICSMTKEPRNEPCLVEIPTPTDYILPVLLDCVECTS